MADTAFPQPDAPDAIQRGEEELDSLREQNIKANDNDESPTEQDVQQYLDREANETDGAASSESPNVTVKNNSARETPKPLSNPLHDYATYTYGLTLYILSAEDFNNLQKADADQLNAWKPTYSLISSGGGHRENRQPEFGDDFYFDNFKMTTIVGLNSMTRGTNAIQMTFTVIEPYGLTLLDRIIEAAKSVGSENYLNQPYLLEIDFFGSRDLGDITSPIPHLRKRIPLSFIEMKIKAGSKGSEYQIQAIPYNHGAFNENSVSTPANFEVTASTVRDFFNNAVSQSFRDQMQAKDDARREREALISAQKQQEDGTEASRRIASAIEDNSKFLNSAYTVDSYTDAVNAWQQKLVDNTHYKYSNEIEFAIDESFADSPIVDPNKTNPTRASMTPTTAADKKAATQGNDSTISQGTPSAGYDSTKVNFNINAGTSVVDVINMVMRNSKYIKSQVIDPTAGDSTFQEDKIVNYFKIVPQIVLKEFDVLRNSYATKTIYHVKPYSYYNSKHPNLPYGTPDGPVKEYNYIYTGKNVDILDFNIEFNTAYYTAKVVDRDNKETTNASAGAETENKPDKGKVPTGSGPNSIAGNQSKPVSAEMNVAATGADTSKTALVANAMNSIYTNSGGDMIQVNLKILGDPHFVKQDDLYTNPGMANYNDKRVMLDSGTISMDSTEIFCRVNFKTPVDMNTSTGLLRLDGRYTVSKFSGLYKILKVESEFSRGQFVQTLEAIRIFEKPESQTVTSSERDDQNASEQTDSGSSPDTRSVSSISPDIPKPPDVSPKSILDKVKAAEEQFVSKAKAVVNEAVDEAKAVANSLRDKLSGDLKAANTLDIGEQIVQDNNSSTPENP